MTEASRPVTIARAYTAAWTSGDFDAAARYVADDVVFDGPLGHTDGKAAYVDGLRGLSRFVGLSGGEILAAFGDNRQALMMYELITERFGTLLCAKLYNVRDGKIERDRLTFDSYKVRQVQSE